MGKLCKKICHKMKMWRRKICVIGLMLFLLCIMGGCFYLNGATSIRELFINENALQNTYYMMSIVSVVFLVIGGIVAVWQYYYAQKSAELQYRTSRIEKAIQLSEYYKDNILCNVNLLYSIYRQSGIYDIIKKFDDKEIEYFDYEEMNNIYGAETIDKIKEIVNSKNFCEIVLKNIIALGFDDFINRYATKVLQEDGSITFGINETGIMHSFLNGLVSKTLNNLEYFSMNFTHDISDESVVYQSLHVTYLELVRLLYYEISVKNVFLGDKLYTNVTELYRIWSKRSKEKKAELKNVKEKGVFKGTTAESI